MPEILKNPWFYLGLLGAYIALKTFIWFLRYQYQKSQYKNRLFLKITLPKDDAPKDKEAVTEKDFRERIAIMAQLYRNLHETRELNIVNQIRVWFLKNNIFSFELVAHNKQVEFYISTPKYYSEIVQKQVVSYYPGANVEPVEDYKTQFDENSKVKGFYAYEARKFWFPIRTYKTIETDPLNDLTSIFTKTESSEIAVIQLVIRPRKPDWNKKAENFGEAFFKGKSTGGASKIPIISSVLNLFKGIVLGADKMQIDKADEQTGFVRMLQTKEEIAKRIGEKANQTGFDTVMRLLASANTEERAEEIANNMIVGLNLFKDQAANWFQTRRIIFLDKLNDKLFLNNFKHRQLDNRIFGFGEKQSLLSEEELASIYHLPCSIYNKNPLIKWQDYKILPAPLNLPDEGILLGHNLYRGVKKEIRFKKKDRSRHHYIIGKSGSGKSALLAYMARQDIINGEGVCVIDPHGDLVEDILHYIPKERAKDVIIFDPADQSRPMGLNMLDAKDSTEMDLISSQATEIFIKLFGDEIFGPRIQHYFRNACLTLMEDQEEGATLIDVPRIFTDDAFLKYKVKKVKNPVVKSFWQNEYANTGDRERQEMIPYFSAKFGPFITNSIMRNTIGQKHSSFNFREVMDQGKILLVRLSKGSIGDLNTQLLGLVIVAKIQMAAMSRADIPEDQRRDFFLYVDEFQNFATMSFVQMLSEARKYKLFLIMAEQSTSQQDQQRLVDIILANVGTVICFRSGSPADERYVLPLFYPYIEQGEIANLPAYNFYMRIAAISAQEPLSGETVVVEEAADEIVFKEVIRSSRKKYAKRIVAKVGTQKPSEVTQTSTKPTTKQNSKRGVRARDNKPS